MRRNTRIDGIKFFLIICVVVGHCIEPTRYTNMFSSVLYSVIYSFHMPLFIFISGYFAKVGSFTDLMRKLLCLTETFLVIMVPQCLVFHDKFLLLNPENSGWYLMSLGHWYCCLYILNRTHFNKMTGGMIFGSVCVSILMFALPIWNGSSLSVNRTVQFFPFFCMGRFCRENKIRLPLEMPKKWRVPLYILVVASVILLSFFSSRTLHRLEFYNCNVWDINSSDLGLLLACRIALMLCASLISFFIIECARIPERLGRYGNKTLLIYTIQGGGTYLE